jgi:gamma-glutamyl-gamma-aminobutyrate hydrolase PuuD
LAAGDVLAGIYGARLDVPTHHHQGIDRLGADLVPTAWAEDGLVEAVTLPGHPWLVGVQWHPEQSGGAELFAEFVRVSAARADGDHAPAAAPAPPPAEASPAARGSAPAVAR